MLPRIQARNFLSGHRTFRIVMLFWSWKSFQQLVQNRILLPSGQRGHVGFTSSGGLERGRKQESKARLQIRFSRSLGDHGDYIHF